MRHSVGRIVDVETVARFDALVAEGARRMLGWRLQGLDLTARTEVLATLDPAGALVFGCALRDEAEVRLRRGGAVVFPTPPNAFPLKIAKFFQNSSARPR